MDDEIRALLMDELVKQLGVLRTPGDRDAQRRALHSVKGSLAMAEERALSETFGRLERRFLGGDADSALEAEGLIDTLIWALRDDQPLPRTHWPEPPGDLRARTETPIGTSYIESVLDRLARVDAALATDEGDEAVWLNVLREVHTIKGAALAIGDELMAWFAHGLEEHLKKARVEGSRQWLDSMAQYRAVMVEILESPTHALATLRSLAGPRPRVTRRPVETPLPAPPKRPTVDYDRASESRPIGDDSVRVAIPTLERLFERAAQIGQARGPVLGSVTALERGAARAWSTQRTVREALRLIGPPKPWGAPAAAIDRLEESARAVGELAAVLERAALQLRDSSERLGRETAQIQASVGAMRTTQAALLFDAIAASTSAQARREGKDVNVVVTGGDTPIERRLADALGDPLLQLTRNSIAHGIEDPETRVRRGKPPRGTVELRAQLRAGALVVDVIDDGGGVDTEEVRRRAVESAVVSAEFASGATERALLALLFMPGFTTRRSVDVLAGRGVGLDLTLATIHRLGGTIQLANDAGRGLRSTIVVPTEGALVKVVWVECEGVTFALPLTQTRRIVRREESTLPVRALREFVSDEVFGGHTERTRSSQVGGLAIEVIDPSERSRGARDFALAVDFVGNVEEVAPRALAPVVRLSGPFGNAILWGDEIRLLLDTDALLNLANA